MLLILLIWFFIAIIAYPIGLSSMSIIKKITHHKTSFYLDIDYSILLGLIIITNTTAILSIFMPINAYTLLFFTPLSIFAIIQYWHIIKSKIIINKVFLSCFLPILAILLYFSSQNAAAFYDTGLYHAQFIQWANHYPIIKGLGNLHTRLAFNNQSFLLDALFYFNTNTIIYPINGFLMLLLSNRLIIEINKNIKSQNLWNTFFYFLITIILCYTFCWRLAASTSPDIFITAFVLYILIYLKDYYDYKNETALWVLFLFIIFIPTIKLSGLFVFILLPFITPITKRNILAFSTLFLFVFIPFLYRNYILSGYLFFPFVQLDFFNPDWKIPAEITQNLSIIIRNWARYCTESLTDPIVNSSFAWLPNWFRGLGIVWQSIIVGQIIFLLLSIIIYKQKDRIYYSFLFLIIINFIFWLIKAPTPRFAYPFLIWGFAYSIFIIVNTFDLPKNILHKINKKYWLLGISAFFIIGHRNDLRHLQFYFFVPKQMENITVKKTENNINVPTEGDRCFNAPLPCTPNAEGVIWRSNRLEDGFRHK